MFGIYTVLFVCAVFAVLYLPRAWCWFASLKPQPRLHNEKKNKLALFIPARDEGKNIIPLLESISRQTYDKNYFDTFIVVRDPEDPVYKYAEIADAEVFCDPNQKCKGDCLNFGFNKVLHKYPGKYDGFLIVDADCLLENTFMEEMNNAMASGADVINAKKRVRNYYQDNGKNNNLITACNGLIWTFMDDMGNRWKSDHGFTTMTVTTGILLKRNIIEKMDGWTYRQTLTEDMELQRDCAVQDYKTFYYSHAVIYMEEAPTLEETDKRRNRWMNGLTHSDYIYFKDMIKKTGLHAFANNYFMFCLWIVYLFVASMLGMAVINLFCCGLQFWQTGIFKLKLIGVSIAAVFAVYLAFFILTAAALIVARHDVILSRKQLRRVLFMHPLFYMGYIFIEARAIFSRNVIQWDSITRVETETTEYASKQGSID